MHVYCWYSGDVPRASSSSPLRTIGPAQSAEGEWPGEGGGAKGRSLSASLREACSCFEASEQKEKLERKRVECVKNSRSRGVLRFFEASERRRDSV